MKNEDKITENLLKLWREVYRENQKNKQKEKQCIRQYDIHDLRQRIIDYLMTRRSFDTNEIELAKLILKD